MLQPSTRDGGSWKLGFGLLSTLNVAQNMVGHGHETCRISPKSVSAQARLAYLDAGPLFNSIIADDWDLYRGSLLDDVNIWRGRAAELLRIRHRIGHCRRPHADDLNRVEQMLRDLEPGAFRAISAYNEQITPDSKLDDPFVAAWCRHEHDDASRLIDHALNQYDIAMRIAYSRRPWTPARESGRPVSGTEGHFWHVGFIFRGGSPLDIRRYWNDHAESHHASQLVYLTATDPFYVEFSFSAVDDPIELSDEVGRIFDRIITNRDRSWSDTELDAAVARRENWKRKHEDLDARVQVATAWSIVNRTTTPIALFGA